MPRSSESTETGLHHRRYERISIVEMEGGGGKQTVTDSYVQMASGLNRPDESGRFVPAEAKFELIHGAAVCQGTAHRVVISGPLADIPLDVQTPDGKRLSSRIIGLSYYSPATGQSVLLCEPRSVPGKLLPPGDAILFEDAFDGGFRADIKYSISLGGLRQDIILPENPPLPKESGLVDDEYVRIEVISEFLNAPVPHKRSK